MPTTHNTNVRISATVRRSVRDQIRFLATERTRAGKPTSESRLWSDAGAFYIRAQPDMPGSRESVSRKISEQVQAQAKEIQALREEIAKLSTETLAQRKFLADLRAAIQPILNRLVPPAK